MGLKFVLGFDLVDINIQLNNFFNKELAERDLRANEIMYLLFVSDSE